MEAEKIICCDRNTDTNALAMALAGRNQSDPMAMAAMMNQGMNSWNNSPWMYLIFLALFGGNGFGFGNRGAGLQDAEIQAKLNALSNQVSDNHNNDLAMEAIRGNDASIRSLAQTLNCDFSQLQTAVCSVRSAIEQVAGQVGYSAEKVINATNLGDMNIIQSLKDCCCQTQQNIIRMGYENQLGQKDLQNAMQQGFSYTNTGIERGISNIGFQMSQMACDIKSGANANTQRIIDTLNQHWQQDLQQRYNDARLELSQLRQNATLIAALKTTTTASA